MVSLARTNGVDQRNLRVFHHQYVHCTMERASAANLQQNPRSTANFALLVFATYHWFTHSWVGCPALHVAVRRML